MFPTNSSAPKKTSFYIMLYLLAGLLILGLIIWYWRQTTEKETKPVQGSDSQVSKNPQNTFEGKSAEPLPESSTPTSGTIVERWSDNPVISKIEVPFDQLPGNFFPSDIPREKSLSDVTQNYVIFTDQNKYQATRVFTTTENPDALYDRYDKYFGDNNWTIINTLKQSNLQAIAASKPKQVMQASISRNSITGQLTVDLSFSYDENLP